MLKTLNKRLVVKSDTSKDRNVGKFSMVIYEENTPKLERQMSPELKESRSATCLELFLGWATDHSCHYKKLIIGQSIYRSRLKFPWYGLHNMF